MSASAPAHAKQRLVLFFDGTWNEPGDHTNVWRLYVMLAERGPDGVPQRAFYDEGVGTAWSDRWTGGAFGHGLSTNVRHGYRWLMEHYNPGDEIFLFGFSRGAFTARSLAGLIGKCGLLKPEAPLSFMQLYDRYQRGEDAAPIYEFKYFHRPPESLEEEILRDCTYYDRNLIKMVGVWDTVGALGVPFGKIKGVSRAALRFHHTRLSTVVEHSYQALALDEYREPYWAALWTNFVLQGKEGEGKSNENRTVEQRWFAGAHANVGGGYRSDLLPQRPLAWMQQKAIDCGLGFRRRVTVDDDDLALRPRDSFAEFMGGAWPILALGNRYVRWIKAEPVLKATRATRGRDATAGWVHTVNERIDPSVFLRCQRHSSYRPPGLREWTERSGIDLEDLIARPEKYPALTEPVTKPGIDFELPGNGRAPIAQKRRTRERKQRLAPTILGAGLLAGALDILYVFAVFAWWGPASVKRILQGIAAGALGREAAVNGGVATAALGLVLHFVIALGAATVFCIAALKLPGLLRRPVISGLLYGVAVWLVMNLAVLPLSATPPRAFPPANWLPILIAHLFCVGLPIAWVARRLR